MLANWTNKFQQYYMVINLVVYPHGRMSELAAFAAEHGLDYCRLHPYPWQLSARLN